MYRPLQKRASSEPPRLATPAEPAALSFARSRSAVWSGIEDTSADPRIGRHPPGQDGPFPLRRHPSGAAVSPSGALGPKARVFAPFRPPRPPRYTGRVQALTREQCREIDRIATEELRIPGLLLMENAAIGIAAAAQELGAGRGLVVVVCGPGNNGGDGLAAARHLANRGADVRVQLALPADAYRDGSDAATNLAIARAMGIPILENLDLSRPALVIDALLGTGLVRDIREPFRTAVAAINGAGCPVLAVDLPSGLDANSGEARGGAVRATVTATMVAPKVGFARKDGPLHVGRVVVVDIGVPPSVVERVARASCGADTPRAK